MRRTVRDGEVVAHRQAPHSASDAGGDALPPQVSHPSGCAPVGWGGGVQRVKRLLSWTVCRDERTGRRWRGYEYSFEQQKPLARIMNSNHSAGMRHVLRLSHQQNRLRVVFCEAHDGLMLTQCSQHDVERVFKANKMLP